VELYREGGPPAVPAERLPEWFEEHWQGACCADSREEAELHAQGLAMLAQYHQQHAAEPVRTLAQDLRMEAEIGGHQFVAVTDRVDEEPDGTLTLLRYKTTRRPPGPGELGQDLSAGLLLLVGERHFQRPARVAVYAARPGKLILADFSPGARRALEQRVAGAAQRLRGAQDYPPRTGRHCRVCRSRPQCPAWQPPPEPSP